MSSKELKRTGARRGWAILACLAIGLGGLAWSGCGDGEDEDVNGSSIREGFEKGIDEASKGVEEGLDEAEKELKKRDEEAREAFEDAKKEAEEGIQEGKKEAEKGLREAEEYAEEHAP